jgi:RNA-splicing ligase RtcB
MVVHGVRFNIVMIRFWANYSAVICDQKNLIWEEAPEAYKDVYAVADDLVREGAAEVVGWCRARVSYKVRNELR